MHLALTHTLTGPSFIAWLLQAQRSIPRRRSHVLGVSFIALVRRAQRSVIYIARLRSFPIRARTRQLRQSFYITNFLRCFCIRRGFTRDAGKTPFGAKTCVGNSAYTFYTLTYFISISAVNQPTKFSLMRYLLSSASSLHFY